MQILEYNPVLFFSRKLNDYQLKYPITDKKIKYCRYLTRTQYYYMVDKLQSTLIIRI